MPSIIIELPAAMTYTPSMKVLNALSTLSILVVWFALLVVSFIVGAGDGFLTGVFFFALTSLIWFVLAGLIIGGTKFIVRVLGG
jgi:hypothetical protein